MEGPTVILLHGSPAAGKYTIGKEIAAQTSLRFFHNHLVCDALLALFEFGSPNFIKFRQQIWFEAMEAAVREKKSFIFTFNPEDTVAPSFVTDLQDRVTAAGGQIFFVLIHCPDEALEARMNSESRQKFRKLTSFDLYQQLTAEGAFDFPPIPVDFSLDSSKFTPQEAATAVVTAWQEWQARPKAT